MIRIGIGYDVHKLKHGETLYIGGIKIPSDFGSEGHSDGDALCHAIVDALLGAASLGDIGNFFPSTNESLRNEKSSLFLIDSLRRIKDAGYEINNIDSTIVIQEPKLENHILKIRKNVSLILKTDLEKISVKATTTDRLGVVGKGKGWAVMTIASIIKKE